MVPGFYQVSYKDFKRVENEVSEGLKDGHERIENAEKAQRRAHGSLENPHHRTSASSVSGNASCYCGSSLKSHRSVHASASEAVSVFESTAQWNRVLTSVVMCGEKLLR